MVRTSCLWTSQLIYLRSLAYHGRSPPPRQEHRSAHVEREMTGAALELKSFPASADGLDGGSPPPPADEREGRFFDLPASSIGIGLRTVTTRRPAAARMGRGLSPGWAPPGCARRPGVLGIWPRTPCAAC